MNPLIIDRNLPVPQLHSLLHQHRVVLIRDRMISTQTEFIQFAESLGELQKWNFGTVNDLRVSLEKQNYLYTDRAVPFHWDGAFTDRVPHWILFYCVAAPQSGGETLFTDTIRLLSKVSEDFVQRWQGIRITYTTEKITHYGGTFTSPVLGKHPCTGEQVLRFAEPVADLNPVQLNIHGIDSCEVFLTDLAKRLRDPECCYAHQWQEGDLVIADNFALLHGRNGFHGSNNRHLRRINVY